MSKFFQKFRTLFRRERSVDSILKPLTKISNDLARHEQDQLRRADAKRVAANKALSAENDARDAAVRAAEKRQKLSVFA